MLSVVVDFRLRAPASVAMMIATKPNQKISVTSHTIAGSLLSTLPWADCQKIGEHLQIGGVGIEGLRSIGRLVQAEPLRHRGEERYEGEQHSESDVEKHSAAVSPRAALRTHV